MVQHAIAAGHAADTELLGAAAIERAHFLPCPPSHEPAICNLTLDQPINCADVRLHQQVRQLGELCSRLLDEPLDRPQQLAHRVPSCHLTIPCKVIAYVPAAISAIDHSAPSSVWRSSLLAGSLDLKAQ